MGIPPSSIQHSDAKIKTVLDSSAWAELIIAYDIQRFLNRLHTAMFTHITAHGGVHESEVAMWETEFESLKPLISKHESGMRCPPFPAVTPIRLPEVPSLTPCLELSRFYLLAAQLEIQLYYFVSPPNTPVPAIKSHAVRVFNTARSIIAHSLDLEAQHQVPHSRPAMGRTIQPGRRLHHHWHPALRLLPGNERARRHPARATGLWRRAARVRT